MTTQQAGNPTPPKILLVATKAWFATARLAMALQEAGFAVEAVCRRKHPMRLTSAVERTFGYAPQSGLKSVQKAIAASQPDLILWCDEPALVLLYRVHATADTKLAALIERSVGNPEHFETVVARSRLMQLAESEGVGIPATRLAATVDEIPACIADVGLPLVLKTDASSGGTGVRVVWEAKHAAKVWRRLHGPVGLMRTINRVVRDRDWTPVLEFVRRETRVVSAQKYIANERGESAREGNMGVVCWQGKVLAYICMEVVQTWRLRGPSSVLRAIDHPEMVDAARKIIGRLGYSGFCGFDFIFDPATGRPLLLEMNPRPTQVAHLALGEGRDLPSALMRAVTGSTQADRPAVTDCDLIALFPHEWQRDPESPLLRGGAYHDVPHAQRKLVLEGLRMRANRGSSGLLDAFKGRWIFPRRAHLK